MFPPSFSNIPPLEHFTGGLFIFVESVGVDVQRRGGLAVAQEAHYCRHVCTVCNQQTGVAVAERIHVQLFRKTILLENQLEPPSEGAGLHQSPRLDSAWYPVANYLQVSVDYLALGSCEITTQEESRVNLEEAKRE